MSYLFIAILMTYFKQRSIVGCNIAWFLAVCIKKLKYNLWKWVISGRNAWCMGKATTNSNFYKIKADCNKNNQNKYLEVTKNECLYLLTKQTLTVTLPSQKVAKSHSRVFVNHASRSVARTVKIYAFKTVKCNS